jgi:ADP-heptose:LPS heptosyltransferase
MTNRLLAVRLDSLGDVILTGPAVRAMAAHGDVTFLAGPIGAAGARLLPGVADVITFEAPWVVADPGPVDVSTINTLVDGLARRRYDAAAIFTSSHQSPLPLALLLRLAGIDRIAAVSNDYPGSLLDVRIPGDPDVHEVERSLMVAAALGFEPAPDDDGRLHIATAPLSRQLRTALLGEYVVVHPGASAPARTLSVGQWCDVVRRLDAVGITTVLTGESWEDPAGAIRAAAGERAVDLMGKTDLGTLATVVANARAVCVGNTGVMHVAAAVGTPTVVVHPPTVPLQRWRPWRVAHHVLGIQDVPCAHCRHRVCPLPVQRCVADVDGDAVVSALEELGAIDAELVG